MAAMMAATMETGKQEVGQNDAHRALHIITCTRPPTSVSHRPRSSSYLSTIIS